MNVFSRLIVVTAAIVAVDGAASSPAAIRRHRGESESVQHATFHRDLINAKDWYKEMFGFDETPKDEVAVQEALARLPVGELKHEKLAVLRHRVMNKIGGLNNPGTFEIITGDSGEWVVDHPEGTTQVASQTNSLHRGTDPAEGISAYILDRAQGSSVDMTMVNDLFYRHAMFPNFCAVEHFHLPQKYVQGGSLFAAGHALEIQAAIEKAVDDAQALDRHMSELDGRIEDASDMITITSVHRAVVTGMINRRGRNLMYNRTVEPFVRHNTVYSWTIPYAPLYEETEEGRTALDELVYMALSASYQSTLLQAADWWLEFQTPGSDQVQLTLVGGGIYNNPMKTIVDELLMALQIVLPHVPLHVKLNVYSRGAFCSLDDALREQLNDAVTDPSKRMVC